MGCFSAGDARQLFHNKFVVILGDSIHRSVYKDLVKFLQNDKYLSEVQLKWKGEISFENYALVEGGNFGEMHNGVDYREVRQYCTNHHLVRFYFLTRVYSPYLESILSDFKTGPQPDVLIMNSCFWDVTRYGYRQMEEYKTNLDSLFTRLKEVLLPECLVIWNMTMPVGYKDEDAPEYIKYNLRWDVIEGNFYSATLADLHNLDVFDFHYYFRFDLQHRCKDTVHWNQLAHRKFTQILLTHIACAWGVQGPNQTISKAEPALLGNYSPAYNYFEGNCQTANPSLFGDYPNFDENYCNVRESPFIDDNPMQFGYFSFDGNCTRGNAVPSGDVHPFTGMNMVMNNSPRPPFPEMNFGHFPHHLPLPPNAFGGPNRFAMKRPVRPREGWICPYLLPLFPPRIY